MSGPWVEKYRPQKLEDIVGQKQIVARLEKYVGEQSMPNLMFTGPAGVGKTTTALALVKSILGIVPLLGSVLKIGYELLIYMFKWRKIYDLLKTFRFKSAMTWAILSVLFKPVYIVLLFIMCDREPDYGYGRFECPVMIGYDGEIVE